MPERIANRKYRAITLSLNSLSLAP